MESDAAAKTDESTALPRSPELMNREDTAVLVVDAQTKLLAGLPDRAPVVWNIGRLLEAAAALSMPTAATEQNAEKLGATAQELHERLGSVSAKLAFSAGACGQIFARWRADGLCRVLVCGTETHICVQQTALDLAAAGFEPYVAVDAVGSRHAVDHETALRRMEAAGVVLTTTEAALFEWCRTAEAAEFKQISALAKEKGP